MTAKDVTLKEYKFKDVKEGHKEPRSSAGYKGVSHQDWYTADIVIHIDTSTKNKWKCARIEYKDDNDSPIGLQRQGRRCPGQQVQQAPSKTWRESPGRISNPIREAVLGRGAPCIEYAVSRGGALFPATPMEDEQSVLLPARWRFAQVSRERERPSDVRRLRRSRPACQSSTARGRHDFKPFLGGDRISHPGGRNSAPKPQMGAASQHHHEQHRARPTCSHAVRRGNPGLTIARRPIGLDESVCLASDAAQSASGRHDDAARPVQEAPLAGVRPTFYQLHLLFDKHYATSRAELVDEVAECDPAAGRRQCGHARTTWRRLTRIAPSCRAARSTVPSSSRASCDGPRDHHQGGSRGGPRCDLGPVTTAPTTCSSATSATNELQVWFVAEHVAARQARRPG